MSNAYELLRDAARLTEELLEAFDGGAASAREIVATLEHRERLLRQIEPGLTPSSRERDAALRLGTLDSRLERAIDDRRRTVASQLVDARRRSAPQPTNPRLVHESA